MEAPTPMASDITIREEISKDIEFTFKNILAKNLNSIKIFEEDKAKTWSNNILNEAKEYFSDKYPDYDLFLFNSIYPINIYFSSKQYSISVVKTDWCGVLSYSTDKIYSALYYLFYKKYNLIYNIEDIESDIIQKGNEILEKHLDGKKYNYNKSLEDCNKINEDYINYILSKNNKLRCYAICSIYEKPIKDKYVFKYISHGKEICSKIFNTYINKKLICRHFLFFFK